LYGRASAEQLAEFVELYKLLFNNPGGENWTVKFVFYKNDPLDRRLVQLIDKYVQQGVAATFTWDVHDVSRGGISPPH
jgi:hypothetical protein